MPPRPYVLMEANYKQLLDNRPNVAVLPWGATEAHNYHMPHGTDVYEAQLLAEHAAGEATKRGAKVIVLPAVPFGNDAQQLDQVATISIGTTTAMAILNDVADSLKKQNIDKLVILNAHGGNEFKPLVRDIQRTGMLIIVVNFWQLMPEVVKETFDEPGDHGGELETALLMHLTPTWFSSTGPAPGGMNAFELKLSANPASDPRPWSQTHPDTVCRRPTQSNGRERQTLLRKPLTEKIAEPLVEVSEASSGAVAVYLTSEDILKQFYLRL
ncbi:MAG: creatininase family protein [Phycisphaerales bacterium]